MESNEMAYKIIDSNKIVLDNLLKKLKDTKTLLPDDIYKSVDKNVDKQKYLYINNQYYRMFKEKI